MPILVRVVLCCAVLGLVACRTTPVLVGESWEVLTVGGEPVMTSSTDMPQAPMFRFGVDSGMVMGYGGCNQFTGPYWQSYDSVCIGPLAITKRMCPHMDLETRIVDAFNRASTVERKDSVLRFLNEDTVLMECRAKVFPKATP